MMSLFLLTYHDTRDSTREAASKLSIDIAGAISQHVRAAAVLTRADLMAAAVAAAASTAQAPGAKFDGTAAELVGWHNGFVCAVLRGLQPSTSNAAISLHAAAAAVRWTYDRTCSTEDGSACCVAVSANNCWTTPYSSATSSNATAATHSDAMRNSSECVRGSLRPGDSAAPPVSAGWYTLPGDRGAMSMALPGYVHAAATLSLHVELATMLSEVGPSVAPMMMRWVTGSMRSDADASNIFSVLVLDEKQGTTLAHTGEWTKLGSKFLRGGDSDMSRGDQTTRKWLFAPDAENAIVDLSQKWHNNTQLCETNVGGRNGTFSDDRLAEFCLVAGTNRAGGMFVKTVAEDDGDASCKGSCITIAASRFSAGGIDDIPIVVVLGVRHCESKGG
jgi:hypothetical protein